jgi:hypothetical protein
VDRLTREQAELQQGWLECRQNVLKLIKERTAAEAERDALRRQINAALAVWDQFLDEVRADSEVDLKARLGVLRDLLRDVLPAAPAEPTTPYTTHGAQTAPMVYSFPDCPHIGPGHWDGTRGRAVCHTCAAAPPKE